MIDAATNIINTNGQVTIGRSVRLNEIMARLFVRCARKPVRHRSGYDGTVNVTSADNATAQEA